MFKSTKNNQAFTLVELIVVITILSILGTIAFISLQGYSKQARDSKRIADISNIKTSLELFILEKGIYPTPDNGNLTTYSGNTVWNQGTIGDNVTINLGRNLKKKPLDPLFETEYIYSITYSQKEYELLSIHEGDLSFLPHPNPLLKDRELSEVPPHPLGEGLGVRYSYAASSYNPKIDGTYNGIFVRTQNYIIPTPSIINSSLHYIGGVLTDTTIDSQVISDGENIPSIGNSVELSTGGLDLTLSVTGTIDNSSTDAEKISVIEAIQAAYSGSSLSDYPLYQNLLLQTSEENKLDFVEFFVLNNNVGSAMVEEEGGEGDTSNYGNLFIDGEDSIEDENGEHSITNHGAVISTTEKKYGDSSIYFDGAYFEIADSSDFKFGSGDFTVDFWMKSSGWTTSGFIQYANGGDWGDTGFIIRGNNGSCAFESGGPNISLSSDLNIIDDNTWHHIAVVRNDTNYNVYVDGISILSSDVGGTINDISTNLIIGSAQIYSYYFPGYMDNIRLVKGEALWTENFGLTDEELFY